MHLSSASDVAGGATWFPFAGVDTEGWSVEKREAHMLLKT
jgi:hypothetical protein